MALGVAAVQVGTRTVRNEFLLKPHQDSLPSTLRKFEEQIREQHLVVEEAKERHVLKRINVFENAGLFVVDVMVEGFSLNKTEVVNGMTLTFDDEVLHSRDQLVLAYKPLFEEYRKLCTREVAELSDRLLRRFAAEYAKFEDLWLTHKEIHAVEALQPLANAILTLEPLMTSMEKEKLLPWPRVQHQKVVTLRGLEGYSKALIDLSSYVLSSLNRELSHDPRLLMLLEYICTQSGDPEAKDFFLFGLSGTPEVAFPESTAGAAASLGGSAGTKQGGSGIGLEAYSFRMLGQLVHKGQGMSSAQSKALSLAKAVLRAFDDVKEFLLSVKPQLECIDANLDRNADLITYLTRYEATVRKARRLLMEPGNLV